jgi:trimeric autotransporter adhesin
VEPIRSCPFPRSRLFLRAVAVSGVLLAAACSDNGTSRTLKSMGVTPTNPSLAIGSTLHLIATGTYSDSSTGDFTSSATWTSSDSTIATVSSAGVVTGVARGTATITATSSGVSGSTTVTVTAATLNSIAVTPTNPTLNKGTTQQFTATGTFSDNSTQDLTTEVTWASSTTSVATVSSGGLATGVGVGATTISATKGGITGSTVVTVVSLPLVSIAVTPPNPSIAKGTTQQFTATGTYSDNSTQDLTTQVTWASDTTGVATISGGGLATAVAVGTAHISATKGAITGSTGLTVTPAILQSIAVTPANPSLAKGTMQQLTATGTYSDLSTQDLTTQVAWASDTAGVATVSNAAGTKGLATAVAVGTATISATTGSVTGATLLTVTPAMLRSIAVTPTNPSVAKGIPVQFTAMGTYTDSTTQDITSQVTWASTVTTVATISNAAGSQGKATTLGIGATSISATLGSVTGTTMLTVTAATLQSIAVTPPTPSAAAGTTLQFTATGTFSDTTTQNLTSQVTWASSATTVATISNAAASRGVATAVSMGTSTISASLSGVSGSTVLTVTPATLQSIAVTPTNPSVAKGSPVQFTATGTFSDNSTQDLTNLATWMSSMPTVATVSNAAGSKGLASTLATGSTSISAAVGAVTGATTLTVTAATLQSISVTPATPSRPVGITLPFTATGIFTDGTTQDLTTQVTWSSSSTSVATISNAAGSNGVATTVAQGTTTIGATLGAVSGSTLLTVTNATLNSIVVTPVNPSIAKGTTQQFTATGNYSDGSSLDLTQAVTWASSMTSVATISNAAGSKGKASAAGVGTTTISAAFGGKTGSTLLTVTPAILVSIAVTPASPSIARGLTEQFVATGTFGDGSTQVLTNAVTWSSSNTVVASIANVGSPGLATGLSVGTTTIRATLGTISGSTSLQVTDAILVSIEVSPDNVTIPRTTTQQFTALGTFSDSAVVDLTTQVTWSSSDNTVIVISNAAGSQGLATALSKGNNITITATKGAVSGTARAKVP